MGEGPLPVDQLVELKVAGVTPEMIETVKGMGYEPTVNTLVGFGHAGITPEYVKETNARFGKKLSAESLAELKHLGVTPDYIRGLKESGLEDLKPDELVELRALAWPARARVTRARNREMERPLERSGRT